VFIIVSYELHLSTHEVYKLLICIGNLYFDSSTLCLIRTLVPYHYVIICIIVVKLCCFCC